MSDRLLTAAELAAELRISIRTLRRLVADGSVQKGSYVRAGRQLRFRGARVLADLAGDTAPAKGASFNHEALKELDT